MITYKKTETIFAHSSGRGKSGVSVFRVSGPEAGRVAEALTGKKISDFKARYLYYSKIHDPGSGVLIDEAMVVYFKNGSSFTGEDVVEIHLHGSIAVIKLMHKALFNLNYIRQAEAGEFTKRAFLNGKLDLTSAEGLSDLIDAETEMQHQQAIRQLGGGLYKLYESWRQDLITIMAMIEAYIDFPDEEIPDEAIVRACNVMASLRQKITEHLNDNRNGERLRSGLKLAIIGTPNVGKSSLLNYLMQRNVAIVSDIPGTTRDVIEGHLDIGGYPIIIQDTAGIRVSDDILEQIGIEKAKEIQKAADIKLIVLDISKDLKIPEEFTPLLGPSTIILINKTDLIDPGNRLSGTPLDDEQLKDCIQEEICHSVFGLQSEEKQKLKDNMIFTSTKNKLGLDELLTKLVSIAETTASPSEHPQITRQRHRLQLEKVVHVLNTLLATQASDRKMLDDVSAQGQTMLDIYSSTAGKELGWRNQIAQGSPRYDLVMVAEDLRMTTRYLSNITGDITVEEILGEIFSNFCIGK